MDYSVEYRSYSAERSLAETMKGNGHAEAGRVHALKELYPSLIRVDEPLLRKRELVAFSMGESDFAGWNSIKGKSVGFMRGWQICEINTKGVARVERTTSLRSLFIMLKEGRIDYALAGRLDGTAASQDVGMNGLHVHDPPLESQPVYLYLHSSASHLLPLISQELKHIHDSGKTRAIIADYIHRGAKE
ncbi:substrate-binding periplasmic protein [Limisalsivibrio acetivorans]|uniref:substrate-binding periplasmic protein n=1 Tax=Limisalsivibrio acetivorans TaxID=1304888 RepID=UPI00138AFE6E|nr:transporter substrate-binding domain-containing protein [Limisalsivibrio acetivorans]